jgi:ribulose-5-phosphate 4-epimerase/fuculose-1-phosphate aldolase
LTRELLNEERADLASALRAAALHGFHEGIENHFSLAIGDGRFLLNGFGPHWSEIEPEDILEVDDDGNVLSGRGRWEQAAFTIHRAVHLARPSARAIFHTHMPYATAVANTLAGLDTRLTQSAMFFHDRTAMLDFDGIATASAEGERLRAAISGETAAEACAVFMRNHGVMVIGESIPDAWYKLYLLERACQVQVLTLSQGVQTVRVSAEIAVKTAAQWREVEQESAQLLFQAVRRQIARL